MTEQLVLFKEFLVGMDIDIIIHGENSWTSTMAVLGYIFLDWTSLIKHLLQ